MTPNDPGQRMMEAKARRRRVMLCLGITALVLLSLFRWLQSGPAPVVASPNTSHSSDTTSTSLHPQDGDQLSHWRPIQVQWDVTLERNFLASSRSMLSPDRAEAPTADSAMIQQLADRSIQVQAIMVGDRSWALINGGQVVEGDQVNGFKVVRIEGRRVQVERDGQYFWVQP